MISGRIRQRAEWPSFVWNRSRLAPLEDRFLHESGRRVGAWRHLPDQDRTELRIEWLSAEALGTSVIEGEILDRASVQSSIRRQFGLSGDLRGVTPAEAGVAEMKVALCHTFDSPLDHFDQLVAGQLGHRGRSFRLELHRGGPTGDQIVACQQRAVHARGYRDLPQVALLGLFGRIVGDLDRAHAEADHAPHAAPLRAAEAHVRVRRKREDA